jgi:peptidyl-tRNA hydrolase, PTH1 family
MSQVVIGLGNPGPEYHDTRHNVGQRVLDVLATRLHRAWRSDRTGMVARTQWRGVPLVLVKPRSFMNVSGPVVATALRHAEADAADLVLVYDDIDMELGKVRTRMKGSAGGHNGVRSVIEALGTDAIRRVKIGIGRPTHKGEVPDHVLSVFEAAEMPAVDAAVEAAADRVLELVAGRR